MPLAKEAGTARCQNPGGTPVEIAVLLESGAVQVSLELPLPPGPA